MLELKTAFTLADTCSAHARGVVCYYSSGVGVIVCRRAVRNNNRAQPSAEITACFHCSLWMYPVLLHPSRGSEARTQSLGADNGDVLLLLVYSKRPHEIHDGAPETILTPGLVTAATPRRRKPVRRPRHCWRRRRAQRHSHTASSIRDNHLHAAWLVGHADGCRVTRR